MLPLDTCINYKYPNSYENKEVSMLFLRNKIAIIFVLSMFLSSLTISANSSLQTTKIGDTSNSFGFSTNQEVDNQVVKVALNQDLDRNCLQDSFERTLEESNPQNYYEAIISFSKEASSSEYFYLDSLGIDIITEYSVIHAFHIKGTSSSLLQLRNMPNVVFVEENSVGEALLYDVTETFGIRKVWQTSLDYGYIGDPTTAIAILDTGIDDVHTDSAFNLLYWQDFAGVDYSTSGDEYLTPTDKAEHGTHCASIAASKGAVVSNGVCKIQDSGFLPNTAGNAWYGTWFYVDGPQMVTLNFECADSGTSYVGIHNGTHWIGDNYGTGFTSTPGTFAVGLPSAGWYAPMWGNKASAGNDFYSGELVYDSGWSNPYSDGRGAFAGVAPGSSVVALKVLDDMGYGSATALINAIQWLYDNGQTYGVTVASLSIGWPSVVSSIDSALSSLIRDKGIVCVVAAGNSGTSSGGIFSPASCPDVIAVGAVNKAAEITYYSSIGSVTDSYMRPDVVAPGGSFASSGSTAPDQPIFAADSSDGDDAYNYNDYVQYSPGVDSYANNFRGMQGTSMACPFVAGIAQLVVDAMKQEGMYTYGWDTAKKIKQIICMATSEVRNIEGSISAGGESYDGDGDGIPQVTTINRIAKDYVEGWGLVSAEAAVQAVTEFFDGIEVFDLSGKVNGSHVAARQVDLEKGEIYYLRGEYLITNFIDADILIFDIEPNEFGDPMLLANCSLGVVLNDSTIFSVPDDGTYYMIVKWVDGNYEGKCNVTLNSVVDAIDSEMNRIRQSGTELDLIIQTDDILSLTYYWDAGAPLPLTSATDIYYPVGDGQHILTINAVDYFGNTAEANLRCITDDTKPVIQLVGLSNNSIVTAGQIIQISITEPHLSSNEYSWDGGAYQDMFSMAGSPYNVTVPDEEGAHYIIIKSRDKAHNEQIVRYSFEIEKAKFTGDPVLPVVITLLSLIGLSILGRRKRR